MTALTDRLIHATNWLQTATTHIHRAERNLKELSPGFPPTTPGNGEPGGGSTGHGDTTVERGAEHHVTTDETLTALARLNQLSRQLQPIARDLHDLTVRWGYITAGEYTDKARHQPSIPEPAHNAGRWCASCQRIGTAEPVTRRNLCNWCAHFEDRFQVLPSPDLLDYHHRGNHKISTAAAEADAKRTKTGKPARKKMRR
jgi:hypothetical protein